MHGIEEGLLDKGCAEASDLLYLIVKSILRSMPRLP